MWPFSKSNSQPMLTTKQPFNWTALGYIILSTFLIIYVIGYYFDFIKTTPGVLALILMVFLAVGIVFAVVKKQIKNQEMSRRDLLAVVVVTILTISMMVLLRDNLPEAFGQSLSVIKIQAQSFLPLP